MALQEQNPTTSATSFEMNSLIAIVSSAVEAVKGKISTIKANQSSISIGDMFEMQMMMNNLAQLSEMATGVVSSAHNAINSMARNVKS